MTTLDTIAMVIGYLVMFLAVFFAGVVMPIIYIGRSEARKNIEAYERERIKRNEPH